MYPQHPHHPPGTECSTSHALGTGLASAFEATLSLAAGALYGGSFAVRRVAETLMWGPPPPYAGPGAHGCCGHSVHHHYHDCCVPPCHGGGCGCGCC